MSATSEPQPEARLHRARPGGVIPARVGRFSVPDMILDLDRRPGDLAALAAGALALLVAGLDPKVFGPGTPTVQAMLRTRPEVENLFILVVVVQAGFYLVGGALGDLIGRRTLLLAGLAGLVGFEGAAIVAPPGLAFGLARLGVAASLGLVIPVAIATIATRYVGAARATALGLGYALFGLGLAIAPALLLGVMPRVGPWPSLLLAAVMTGVALAVAWRWAPTQEPGGLRTSHVVGHGLWAFGLLCVAASLVGISGDGPTPLRVGIALVGVVTVGGFLAWQRWLRGQRDPSAEIDTAR